MPAVLPYWQGDFLISLVLISSSHVVIFVIWFPHRHRRWFIHFYRRSFCRISASLSRKPAVVLSSMWLLSMLRSACLTLISENANRFFQPSSLKDICVARSLFCDCGTKLRLRAGWRMSDEVMSEKINWKIRPVFLQRYFRNTRRVWHESIEDLHIFAAKLVEGYAFHGHQYVMASKLWSS